MTTTRGMYINLELESVAFRIYTPTWAIWNPEWVIPKAVSKFQGTFLITIILEASFEDITSKLISLLVSTKMRCCYAGFMEKRLWVKKLVRYQELRWKPWLSLTPKLRLWPLNNSVALGSDGITAGNQGPRSETSPLSAVGVGLGVTVQAFSEEKEARGQLERRQLHNTCQMLLQQ